MGDSRLYPCVRSWNLQGTPY